MRELIDQSGLQEKCAPVSDAAPYFVSRDAIQAVLTWEDVLEKLRQTYSLPHAAASTPPRSLARGEHCWIRTLTAVPPGSRYMGAKMFGVGPEFQVNYAIILVEQNSGLIHGIVDGALVTSLRTAALSALAVDRLAAKGRITLGVLGSGEEARTHIDAIASIRQINQLKVYSPTVENRRACANHFADTLGIQASAVDKPEDAVRHADVVVAAARSHDEAPILFGSWLSPDTMVVSIGSTLAEQREIDTSVVEVCDLIVCDAVDEVVNETGDMIAATQAGIAFADKLVPLNDLMSGLCNSRLQSIRLPMFKSVGSAIQDIVVAELAFDRSVERGLAQAMPIEFYTKTQTKR